MPPSADALPPMVVVMGVAGSGKTTIGRALALRLGWRYRDADEFHSAANVAKMRAGEPLDDADRAPWLTAIGEWMDKCARGAVPAVIGCSALKRRYRDALRGHRPQVWFVYLRVPRAELDQRLHARRHHFMSPSLLDSQLQALEEPLADEPKTITFDAAGDVDDIVAAVVGGMRRLGMLA